MDTIPLNDLGRHIGQNRERITSAMQRVVERGWFVLGPETLAFEHAMCSTFGLNHAVGVGNGTDALELALRSLDVSAGDEVILAPNAGMYAATALRAIGAHPVYADINEDDLNLSPASVLACRTPRTRAVVVTHLYGRMALVHELAEICRKHGLKLVEDCAQAIGARRNGDAAGSLGDCAAFSFYPTKNLGALGDGGLVACREPEVAERLRRLRQYGWTSKYVVSAGGGRNTRLDELQAAVLLEQLPLLAAWNQRRRVIAQRFASTSHPEVRHPSTEGEDYVAHLYVVRSRRRQQLREHLESKGVASDIHYPLLDTQQLQAPDAQPLPVAERANSEILTLPCFPELDDDEVAQICEALVTWR